MSMEIRMRKIWSCVTNAKFAFNPKFACHQMPPIK